MWKRFWNDMRKYFPFARYSARSDLKAEVASSYLNWLWWILNPLMFMLVYTFIAVTVFNFSDPVIQQVSINGHDLLGEDDRNRPLRVSDDSVGWLGQFLFLPGQWHHGGNRADLVAHIIADNNDRSFSALDAAIPSHRQISVPDIHSPWYQIASLLSHGIKRAGAVSSFPLF